MNPQDKVGRRLVLAVIAATLTLSVLTIVAYNTIQGQGRLPQQAVRLLLTAVLSVFLFRGANWARWVAIFLFGLAGLGGLLGGLTALSTSTAGLLLLGMSLVHITSAAILLFVPEVRKHFGATTKQRANNGMD